MSTLSLLLVAFFGAFCIARLNRSTRVFGILMLALTLGFAGGASAAKIVNSLEKSESTVLISANVENGENNSTAWVVETPFAWKATTGSYSSMLGKSYFCSDILSLSATPRVTAVHPIRCMSPPSHIVSDYLLAKAFSDTS